MTVGNIMFFAGLAMITISIIIALVSLVTSGIRKRKLEEYLNKNYGQDN